MFSKKRTLAVIALVMLPAMACQASWMRQEGEVAASASVSVSEVGEFFDRAGTVTRNTCGSGIGVPMTLEYGHSYYHTLFASTSIHSFNCPTLGQVTGFSDIELGARGRVDVFKSDHTWEASGIIPSHITPNGGVRKPKNWGIRLAIHSSDRVDPYMDFLEENRSGKTLQINTISYGAGMQLWEGHLPNELFAYLGWRHILSESRWSQEAGGWDFSARLDAMTTFGKEHTLAPGLLVHDVHDKSELLSLRTGFSHALSRNSSTHISLTKGLWGRNASSPLSISVGYSQNWRD